MKSNFLSLKSLYSKKILTDTNKGFAWLNETFSGRIQLGRDESSLLTLEVTIVLWIKIYKGLPCIYSSFKNYRRRTQCVKYLKNGNTSHLDELTQIIFIWTDGPAAAIGDFSGTQTRNVSSKATDERPKFRLLKPQRPVLRQLGVTYSFYCLLLLKLELIVAFVTNFESTRPQKTLSLMVKTCKPHRTIGSAKHPCWGERGDASCCAWLSHNRFLNSVSQPWLYTWHCSLAAVLSKSERYMHGHVLMCIFND